jgi:hypothetical protein
MCIPARQTFLNAPGNRRQGAPPGMARLNVFGGGGGEAPGRSIASGKAPACLHSTAQRPPTSDMLLVTARRRSDQTQKAKDVARRQNSAAEQRTRKALPYDERAAPPRRTVISFGA